MTSSMGKGPWQFSCFLHHQWFAVLSGSQHAVVMRIPASEDRGRLSQGVFGILRILEIRCFGAVNLQTWEPTKTPWEPLVSQGCSFPQNLMFYFDQFMDFVYRIDTFVEEFGSAMNQFWKLEFLA